MYCSAVLAVLVLMPVGGKTGSLTVHRTAEGPDVIMVNLYRVGASGAEPQLMRTRELLNPKAPSTTPPRTIPQLVSIRELLKPAPKALLGPAIGSTIGSATGALIGNAADRAVDAGTPKPRDRSLVTWKNLPEGTYDICFEAKGYTKSVKRVRVSHDDGDELEIWAELGEPVQKSKKGRVRK